MCIADAAGDARNQHRANRPWRQRIPPEIIEAIDESSQPDPGQDEAFEVEVLNALLTNVGDELADQREAQQAHRHIDEEDPAP
jgi:hypothetical protein